MATRDYFTDHAVLKEPYAWFEAVRAKGPIHRLPESGIVVVTGFDEMLEVLRNTTDFSSAIAPQGAGLPLPFAVEGDDLTAAIDAHRTQMMGGDLIVALDDRPHAFSRSILARPFTPSRLRANEAFMTDFADRMVREIVAKNGCELIAEIATPFVTIVIADLLGVPEDDRKIFMQAIEDGAPAGSLNTEEITAQAYPLMVMGTYFAGYVAERRETPREDVLSELANATYPDGSTPDMMEIVRLATFLFAAGQDTSAKLLGNVLRFIVDEPGLQARLRADPSLIPALLEEVLRLEGSTKVTARVARRATRIGKMEIAVGTRVMLSMAAANRDPRRWDEPEALLLDRPKIREHLGFGRGAHVCIGAPLARVEVRVILEKLLEHTAQIDLDEAEHGRPGARTLEYEPSFIIRGLESMHLKLTPAPGFVAPVAVGAKPEASDVVTALAAWSTATTRIGALLADPAARAIIDRHFPGVSDDPRIGIAKGMTLRTVQKFAPEMFTTAALDAVDVELSRSGTA